MTSEAYKTKKNFKTGRDFSLQYLETFWHRFKTN